MKCSRELRIAYLIAVSPSMLVVPLTHSEDKKASSKQTEAKADQTKKYVWPTDPSLYVGSDTYKTCHEEIYTHFASTAHFATTMDAKLDAQKGVEWHGWEACHGPETEHVEGGGDKRRFERLLPGLVRAEKFPGQHSHVVGAICVLKRASGEPLPSRCYSV